MTTKRLRSLGTGVLAVTGLLAVAAAAEHHREAVDRAEVRARSTLFTEGDRKIRYRLVGADQPGPTVVFVTGWGGCMEQSAQVQDVLASVAPTLTYDRGGNGFSDPIPGHDAAAMAEELAGLTKIPGVKPPLVLVSFSSSGFVPGAFGHAHPDLVGGFVFLDVTPAEQVIRLTTKQYYHRRTDYERQTLIATAEAFVGWARLKYAIHPEASREVMEALESTSHWWATYKEGAYIGQSAEESEQFDFATAHVPVTVLSMAHPDGDADSRMRYRAHRRVAEQSGGRFVHQPSWPHGHIMDMPLAGEVAQLIADVVRQARAGAAPSPASAPGTQGSVEEVVKTAEVLHR
jgi:pimeloyl-ACP methyl ester carboxylesterase